MKSWRRALLCAAVLALPGGASGHVAYEPANIEVARREVWPVPEGIHGRVCIDIPQEPIADIYLRKFTDLLRWPQNAGRNIVYVRYEGGCERPGAILRVQSYDRRPDRSRRIVAEWWVSRRDLNVPPYRARRRVYEERWVKGAREITLLPEEMRGQ